MRSYLVLTPPKGHAAGAGADREHRSTLVLPDGFSWMALLFPWIWLAWHRLWLAAILVFAVQVASGMLIDRPGFWLAGTLLGLATSLLVAFEGRNYRANALVRRGWVLETVIPAHDLNTAEAIYFSGLPQPESLPMPASADWAKNKTQPAATGWQGPALGLFDNGGR